MSAKVTDRDNGLAAFLKTAKSLNGLRVKVGVQGPEASSTGSRDGGPTNAELMAYHEYGAPQVSLPQRSSLRSTADENQKKYQKQLAGAARAGAKARDLGAAVRALHVVGETYRADVIKRIKAGIPPELKPETIARKGGDTTPLIDTGSMIGAISVVVGKSK